MRTLKNHIIMLFVSLKHSHMKIYFCCSGEKKYSDSGEFLWFMEVKGLPQFSIFSKAFWLLHLLDIFIILPGRQNVIMQELMHVLTYLSVFALLGLLCIILLTEQRILNTNIYRVNVIEILKKNISYDNKTVNMDLAINVSVVTVTAIENIWHNADIFHWLSA